MPRSAHVRGRLVLFLLVAPLVVSPTASAEAGKPELPLVQAYLAQFDAAVSSGMHCARHGGPWLTNETLALPGVGPLTHTNELLAKHTRWHGQWNGMRFSSDFRDDAMAYGLEFVLFHRLVLAEFDAWRVANGHAPVAAWDPATPIPPEFAPSTEPGCLPRDTDDPHVELPAWATVEGGGEADPLWGYEALCEFPDLNRLGKSIDYPGREGGRHSYHALGHGVVGGDMNLPQTSMRDPVFWAWHRWLDLSVFDRWERACAAPTEAVSVAAVDDADTASETARGVPGWGAAATSSTLAACAAAFRRRR